MQKKVGNEIYKLSVTILSMYIVYVMIQRGGSIQAIYSARAEENKLFVQLTTYHKYNDGLHEDGEVGTTLMR